MHFRPKIFGVFTTILMELNFRGLHNEKLVIFFNSDGQQTPGTSGEIVTIFKRGDPRTDCGGGGGDEGSHRRRENQQKNILLYIQTIFSACSSQTRNYQRLILAVFITHNREFTQIIETPLFITVLERKIKNTSILLLKTLTGPHDQQNCGLQRAIFNIHRRQLSIFFGLNSFFF